MKQFMCKRCSDPIQTLVCENFFRTFVPGRKYRVVGLDYIDRIKKPCIVTGVRILHVDKVDDLLTEFDLSNEGYLVVVEGLPIENDRLVKAAKDAGQICPAWLEEV